MTQTPPSPRPAPAGENIPPPSGGDFLFVCRAGYETVLREEIAERIGKPGRPAGFGKGWRAQDGVVLFPQPDADARNALASGEFVFERQRLPEASPVLADSIKTFAQAVIQDHFPPIDRSDLPWTLHAFTPDVEEFKSLRPRVKNIEKALLEKLKKRFGRMRRRYAPAQTLGGTDAYLVVQLCMDLPGRAYLSIGPKTPLIHPFPGGEQRMSFDPRSPSRSYLKLSEAVSRLRETPLAGQTAVDLGAAPGGWSCFLLKAGCRVTAVDRGPMKIKDLSSLPGELKIVGTDGMRFAPEDDLRPFDWMCCDMLRPPRQTLELLEKWIARSWMKRFVVNVKLPQKNPLALVREAEELLAKQDLDFYKIKQLYHDRDEITLMGRLKT
ncbi:MAG: hypothetical protein HY580_05250 [Nitrospinae bacterium]|nr:hypothetical protein [Nitrospinota bacterium]